MRKSKWLAMAVLAFGAIAAEAQTYPVKPVHFIVPFALGTAPDVVARLVGEGLASTWRQPVIVENRPGAVGNMGTAQVARAAPDGYTVLVTASVIAINVTLWPNPGYDLRKDFVGVINVATSPLVIVAGAKFPGATLREAIDKAKAGGLTFGTGGAGTPPFMVADYLFRVLAKGDVTHVPYKGGPASIAAALAGDVDVISIAISPPFSLIKAGRLRALAVTGAKRSRRFRTYRRLPSRVPGFRALHLDGRFCAGGDAGECRVAPQRRHREVALERRFPRAVGRARVGAGGGSPQSFARYIESEIVRWAKVVKETGAKPE